MTYRPNQIPAGQRIVYVLLAMLLLVWGTVGVSRNDLLYPGWDHPVHLTGPSAWLMYGAMICAALVLFSVVLDHYDRRNNETSYRVFALRFSKLGWILFGASLVTHVLMAIYIFNTI